MPAVILTLRTQGLTEQIKSSRRLTPLPPEQRRSVQCLSKHTSWHSSMIEHSLSMSEALGSFLSPSLKPVCVAELAAQQSGEEGATLYQIHLCFLHILYTQPTDDVILFSVHWGQTGGYPLTVSQVKQGVIHSQRHTDVQTLQILEHMVVQMVDSGSSAITGLYIGLVFNAFYFFVGLLVAAPWPFAPL